MKFSAVSNDVGVEVRFCSKNLIKGFRLVAPIVSGCYKVKVVCTEGVGEFFLAVWLFIQAFRIYSMT